ncbi:MAG TPA: hypothetical protein VK618_10435 [Flavitalea sp.]|nr:hypothetical protein [Flavitalea sp.]
MNSLSRNKVLLAIVVLLLLTNLGMLIFIFSMNRSSDPPRKGPGFTERLRKEVGFTEDQMKVFEPKKKAFWTMMNSRFEAMHNTKEQFYLQLYDPAIPDSILVSKASEIGNLQRDIDLQVIRHFKDVRKMCRPDQLIKYDSLLPPIIHRMTQIPGKK